MLGFVVSFTWFLAFIPLATHYPLFGFSVLMHCPGIVGVRRVVDGII